MCCIWAKLAWNRDPEEVQVIKAILCLQEKHFNETKTHPSNTRVATSCEKDKRYNKKIEIKDAVNSSESVKVTETRARRGSQAVTHV